MGLKQWAIMLTNSSIHPLILNKRQLAGSVVVNAFPKTKEVFAELINIMHQLLQRNWQDIVTSNKKKKRDSKNKNQDRVMCFFTPVRHSFNSALNKSL